MKADSAFLPLFLFASASLGAAEAGAPLAVTVLAEPYQSAKPTAGQLATSQRDLQAGQGFLKDGQPQKAVQAFNDSVLLAPGAENYKALGMAYYQTGNLLKASWACTESLRLKPDPAVRALLDAMQRGGRPGDPSPDSPQARYTSLYQTASGEAQTGRTDDAIRDFMGAYALQATVPCGAACLRTAADAVDADLKQGELAKAIETLCRVETLRRAKALTAAAAAPLARLAKDEDRAVLLSGLALKDNAKAMEADRSAWERSVQEKAAGVTPAAQGR